MGNKIEYFLVAFRLLLNQRQRIIVALQEQQSGNGGNKVAMLMLHGAQVIGVLPHLT